MPRRLFRLLPNGPQLLRRQQVLLAAQRLFGADQIVEGDDAAAAAEDVDFHGPRTDALEIAHAENGAEDIDCANLGLQIKIPDREAVD